MLQLKHGDNAVVFCADALVFCRQQRHSASFDRRGGIKTRESLMKRMSIGARVIAGVVASALAALLSASAATAQNPDMVRVRGTIQGVDGQTLDVKGRDGAPLKVKLADDVKVLAVDRKSMADVKQGVFVGITAMPQPDGSQKAVEIHIFPEALRGTGEGHRPWDLMPNSTMTNANIESAVASSDGKELVLKYKDGEKKFVVPANVEVVMFDPAAVADLKPGEKIFVVAGKKQADGTILAPSIVVGRNGVNPPM
jgi:outer membrane lipoprotein SlyB